MLQNINVVLQIVVSLGFGCTYQHRIAQLRIMPGKIEAPQHALCLHFFQDACCRLGQLQNNFMKMRSLKKTFHSRNTFSLCSQRSRICAG